MRTSGCCSRPASSTVQTQRQTRVTNRRRPPNHHRRNTGPTAGNRASSSLIPPKQIERTDRVERVRSVIAGRRRGRSTTWRSRSAARAPLAAAPLVRMRGQIRISLSAQRIECRRISRALASTHPRDGQPGKRPACLLQSSMGLTGHPRSYIRRLDSRVRHDLRSIGRNHDRAGARASSTPEVAHVSVHEGARRDDSSPSPVVIKSLGMQNGGETQRFQFCPSARKAERYGFAGVPCSRNSSNVKPWS